MKRSVPLSLVASVVFACLGGAAGQAATLTSGHLDASTTHALSVVSKTGWHRHRHCWWHHHRRHCRHA